MSYQFSLTALSPISGCWCVAKDGDPAARALFHRHYSRYVYRDGRQPQLFVGPGEKQVLLTECGKAVFVWRRFRSADGQEGVNCAIFRNEGAGLSSALIREAMQIGWKRWPGVRFYTYVDAEKVASANPGYCFRAAGWRRVGKSASGKLIFAALPPERP